MPRRGKEDESSDSTSASETENRDSKENVFVKWNRQRWIRSFGIYGSGFLTAAGVITQTTWTPGKETWVGLGVTVGTLISAIVGTKLIQDNVQEITSLRESLKRQQNDPK